MQESRSVEDALEACSIFKSVQAYMDEHHAKSSDDLADIGEEQENLYIELENLMIWCENNLPEIVANSLKIDRGIVEEYYNPLDLDLLIFFIQSHQERE